MFFKLITIGNSLRHIYVKRKHMFLLLVGIKGMVLHLSGVFKPFDDYHSLTCTFATSNNPNKMLLNA